MQSKTCCFTGHRKIPDEIIGSIKIRLRNEIIRLIEIGYKYFGTGGALGFDTIAAQIVLDLKNIYPHIKLILVLPCLTQTKGWNNEAKIIYHDILLKADKVVYTSKEYFSGCMFKRNRHLIDNSSACICYLTKNTGGTAYTVKYASQKGLHIKNIATS